MVERNGCSLPPADPNDASTWSPPPSWLLVPPAASAVSPPVETRPQLLPIDVLSWEDFERLCLRLLEQDADLVHVSGAEPAEEATEPVVRPYGLRGQAQDGIDVYARVRLVPGQSPPDRPFVTLQARRIRTVAPAAMRGTVDEFLRGKWSPVSRKFIYATSSSAVSTELADEIERLASRLLGESIDFVVWDREEVSTRLKECPELVDDFFGRRWVQIFCGDAAERRLGTRLDAEQIRSLRHELATVYRAAFGVADSGQIAFRWGGGSAVGLHDRFVTPDLVLSTPQAASQARPIDDPDEPGMDDDAQALLSASIASQPLAPDEDAWFLRNSPANERRAENPLVSERVSADQWLGTQSRQVIVGEPGAGKSTLLRHLVLDLLSEHPRWQSVAARWGRHLPVWLPFHFFTQRIASQTGNQASVREALKAWLEQNDSGHIWSLVEAALNDARLLLVVDGLDEWVSVEAGHHGLAALRTFADTRGSPLVVSSRPYGLGRLTLGTGWAHARIAPLTPEQQRLLASHYFHARVNAEHVPPSPGVIERSVHSFLSQIRASPDLSTISRFPLFLVLLVGLYLSSNDTLPAGRWEVYDRAVRLLVADHRAQRRTAAAVTAPRQGLTDQQLRTVLARVAFVSRSRGDIATLLEAVLRDDFVDALRDPDGLAMEPAQAAATADQLVTVAEGELGILVRKGPTEVGFLHRMLQDQLAAEYISDQCSPAEAIALFTHRIGDPQWSHVLLAAMSRLRRPAERRQLMAVITERVDDTPPGLRARELVAELIFGHYNLPATDIQQIASDIVEAIETHPYGPHRARLLDTVLTGLGGVTTGDIVIGCLERWTLLVQEPSRDLVRAIAELPPAEGISETICTLLLRALRYPNDSIAYASGLAIAGRCSNGGIGNEAERELLHEGLLQILSDLPSGLAAAAALIPLALEWCDDPRVIAILNEARSHIDESVRIVALSETLGVLRPMFTTTPDTTIHDVQSLSDDERVWLLERFGRVANLDNHFGLLVAALAKVARGQDSALEHLIDRLQGGPVYRDEYNNVELAWLVTLDAFADDGRVVDLVCDDLRSEKFSYLTIYSGHDLRLLGSKYPPGSPHNSRVAAAIEDRIAAGTEVLEFRQFGLAAVDRGPNMKRWLLAELSDSSFPHWAARALAEYFNEDSDARAALRSMLMGDPVRASMIANVAARVLATGEAVPRLRAILRELREPAAAGSGRYDILTSALVHAVREECVDPTPELEAIAEEALTLLPTPNESPRDDLRYKLADGFYPSRASQRVLAELEDVQDRPLVPYLRAFRDEADQIQSLLAQAAMILNSLPAYLRARVCQSLSDRATDPQLILRLTGRWADEVSELNKSIASLAYHRSLLQAREEGYLADCEWNSALIYLGEQASCYGPDHEARRRGSWVGICVCGDWSTLEGRVETIGEAHPVGVSLADMLHGPDWVLLREIASRWEDLRSEFGDTLLPRLSGIREWQPRNDIWDALALVAHQNSVLQQELDDAVASNPELLKLNGVLAWFVTRGRTTAETLADTVISQLQIERDHGENVAGALLVEPERIGLDREELQDRLESAMGGSSTRSGNAVLETLAVLFPENPTVRDAWTEYSEIVAGHRDYRPISLRMYFTVACAAADANKFLEQLEHYLDRLDMVPRWYYDDTLSRHISQRLRRDNVVAAAVRDVVMNTETPSPRAASLVSLLAEAVGVDAELLNEVESRLDAENSVILAPVVRDPTVSATLPVRTILTRVADTAWDEHSN